MRPWLLAETNYAYTKEHPFEVAVLPLGATEPHNLHLPYGTDLFEATILGEKICEEAHRRGAKVVLLPTMPYGTETNMRAFPLAMNVNPSTLGLVVRDLVASLVQSGIRKVLLLNSHGGNDLKPLLRELYGSSPAHLFLCNWYQMVADEYASLTAATTTAARWKLHSALPTFRTSSRKTQAARSPPTRAKPPRPASRP
jgi:creatinine amidohydrolase